MHSAQELVSQIESLASIPVVYQRIREHLDSPESSTFEVARLVGSDPALTIRVLGVVNSALFGHRGKIDSVLRAVQILGLQQVHDIVLSVSLQAMLESVRPAALDIERYWRQSMLGALCARTLAQQAGRSAPERMFVIGLLADIGHLVMYQTTPELAAQAEQAARDGEALYLAERRIVGCDFAEVGATLVEHWGVPGGFAGAIGAQTLPRLGGDYAHDAAILNLARCIVRADDLGLASTEIAAAAEPSVWQLLDFDAAALPAVREEAELNLAAYLTLFFPPRKS